MFFAWLGRAPLYDWDEAWYAQVAKEILRRGDWITLHWRGAPFFDKPPLAIWAIAVSFRLLGQSAGSARLFSALCAGATVMVLYGIGRQVFGQERPARLAALVLLTTLPFVKSGREAMLDAPVTLAFALGIWTFLKARRDRRWTLAIGPVLAVAWLIKGPLAVLLLIVLGAFSLWEKDLAIWRTPGTGIGFLAALAMVLPWYVAEYQRHGNRFLAAHFGYHILARATRAVEGHHGPPWYYLGQLATFDHPWFLVLIPGPLFALKHRKEPAVRLGLCWGVGVIVAFSLAATKLPWYVVPAYPGLALLIAAYLDGLERPDRLLGVAWALLGGTALVACAYLVATAARPLGMARQDLSDVPALAMLGAGLAIAGIGLCRSAGFRKAPWVAAAATYGALVLLLPARYALNWEERWAPDLSPFAAVAAIHTLPAGIYWIGTKTRPDFIYYLDRPEILTTPRSLQTAWAPGAAALLTTPQWRAFGVQLAGARIVASASGLVLVTGRPLDGPAALPDLRAGRPPAP